MISAKYYSSWFKEAGRGHIGALLSWGSFLPYLVLTLMALTLDTDYNFYGMGSRELLYICAGLGTALGFVEFCYLFQQKKQDFYYSLPVRRSTIFWTRYFHGVRTFVIPFILVQGICGIYEAARDSDFLPYAGGYTARSILVFLLIFLLFYHGALLAVMVSGKVSASILMLAVFVFYFKLLIGEAYLVFAKYLFGTYYRIPLLEQAQDMLAPWNLAGKLGGSFLFEKQEVWEYHPGTMPVLAAVVFIILFLAAGILMHKSRKTEMTGSSFASNIPERIAEIALSVLAGLFLAGLLLKLLGTAGERSGYTAVLLCAGGIAGTLAVHLFMEWMVKKPEDSVLRRKRQIALEGAGVILTIALFWGLQSPYDRLKPRAEDIEALAISVNGLDIEQERYEEEEKAKSSYLTDQRLKSYVLKEEGLEKGLEWLEKLSSGEKKQKKAAAAAVCFQMKNGAEKYRIYNIDQEALHSFAAVYKTWEYKLKAYPLAGKEDIQNDRVTWTDGIVEQTLKLTGHEKEDFLKAYKADIEAMEMSDLYKALPSGIIRIESDIARSTVSTVIYPFWERTVSFLGEHGVQVGKELSGYPVSGVKVKASALEPEENDGKISTKFYQDQGDIREWTDELIPKELAVQPVLNPVNVKTEAEVEVEDETTNSIKVIQCYRKK